MAIGPLDKRAIRKRCQTCAQRKVKCEGGPPCTYCTKRGLFCVAQITTTKRSDLVLVHHTPEAILLPPPNHALPNKPTDRYINHFFTTFITKNNFAIDINLNSIISEFQSSSSLHATLNAVAALDLSKRTSSRKTSIQALHLYRTCVINFQTELQKRNFLQSSAGLWTTFFLGLFELMYDISGEGWISHILYGTSKILQLRGPEACVTGNGRSFFLTVRVFEICRALIYSEPSFLSEKRWKKMMSEMWKGDEGKLKEWHPKERLLDLMLDCSELNQLVIEHVDNNPSSSCISRNTLNMLLNKGLTLQSSLIEFNDITLQPLLSPKTQPIDPRTLLTQIYHAATSIYLSGIFDHRSIFFTTTTNNIPSPILSLPDPSSISHTTSIRTKSPHLPNSTIQQHTNTILTLTHTALTTTNLAGVLFFFPLRVAGARVVRREEREEVLRLLGVIGERSFVVAEAFVEDLKGLWGM